MSAGESDKDLLAQLAGAEESQFSMPSQCRQQGRQQCIALLHQMTSNMNEAIAVWQEYLDSGAVDGNKFTLVLWFGPCRAKALYAVYLHQRKLGQELADVSGLPFSDAMGIREEIDIVHAYGQMGDEDSGEQLAKRAIALQSGRKEALRQAIISLQAELQAEPQDDN